jgi:ribosomal protein L14E/L6E/L27E
MITEMKRGTVVVSAAGRDKTQLMVVVSRNEKRVEVCDGKERPLNNPKSKNPRHLKQTGYELNLDLICSDRALRKALREIREDFKEAN